MMRAIPTCGEPWLGGDSPGAHAQHECNRPQTPHQRHVCSCGAEAIEDHPRSPT